MVKRSVRNGTNVFSEKVIPICHKSATQFMLGLCVSLARLVCTNSVKAAPDLLYNCFVFLHIHVIRVSRLPTRFFFFLSSTGSGLSRTRTGSIVGSRVISLGYKFNPGRKKTTSNCFDSDREHVYVRCRTSFLKIYRHRYEYTLNEHLFLYIHNQ